MAESHTPKDDVIQKASESDVIPEGDVASENYVAPEDDVEPEDDAESEDDAEPEDDAETEDNVHQEEDDDILVPVGDIALLATGGNDSIIKMWDVQTGESYRSFKFLDSHVNALTISPERQYVVAAGYKQIRIYDLHSNQDIPLLSYKGLKSNITGVGFRNDGNWMFTCAEDGFARVWDLRRRNNECQLKFQAKNPLNSIRIHPTNQLDLIMSDQNGSIYLWNIRTNHVEQIVVEENKNIHCVAIDPSGNMVASVNSKGECFIWKYNDGAKLTLDYKTQVHGRYVTHCEFSPNSALLATSSADQTARIWNTDDFTLKQELKVDDQKWVWKTAFTKESERVFTVSSDGLARLWNIESGDVEREYKEHTMPVYALAFRDSTF